MDLCPKLHTYSMAIKFIRRCKEALQSLCPSNYKGKCGSPKCCNVEIYKKIGTNKPFGLVTSHTKFRSFYQRISYSKLETPYDYMSKSTLMSMSLTCKYDSNQKLQTQGAFEEIV